jgi:DinB superfamily
MSSESNSMASFTLPQVPSHEAAPFYGEFLAAFPDGRVGAHLQAQLSELDGLCAGLSESGAMLRYAEGKWTIKEVIGHLIDTERVFAYRLLRISRGDTIALSGFDETRYVPEGQFNLRSVNALVSEFRLQRASTIALANGITPAAWTRIGTANGFRTSARALVYIILGHTAHHFRVLTERYRLPVALGAG